MKTITPILAILIAIGLYFGYISPTWDSLVELRAKEAQYVDASQKSKELGQTVETLVSEYNSLSASNIEKINKLIPANFELSKFSADIDGVASANGIRLDSIQILPPAQRNNSQPKNALPYRPVDVTVKFKTSYNNFVGFIKGLEQSLQIIDLVDVSFTTNDNSQNLEFSVLLRTYEVETI